MKILFCVMALGFALWIGSAGAIGLSGSFTAVSEPDLRLELVETADGSVSGELTQADEAMPLRARRDGRGFSGSLGGVQQDQMPCSAVLDGDRLVLTIGSGEDAERLVFLPAVGEGAAFRNAVKGRSALPRVQRVTARSVSINGRLLGDAELAGVELRYGIRIDDADYWYDGVLGAWGVRGGPTLGFIPAGLELGGSLAADVSGGGTGIYVNGRELHPRDVSALQQMLGPILPGRYFITSQGLAGYEGGPVQWNLVAAGGGGSSGSNTWQGRVTGASGFSDGTTSAVFLPNGGIVSTGN